MFISELSIKNFGSFESAEFSFAPTGISAICGANGTGKSQIVGATLAAIIGRRAIKIDQAGIGPSQVRISVEEGNATEEISLAISTNAQGEPLIEESTQPRHPGPLRRRLLTAISGSAGPHLYLPRDPRPIRFQRRIST